MIAFRNFSNAPKNYTWLGWSSGTLKVKTYINETGLGRNTSVKSCITNNRTCTHCHNTDSRRRIYPKPYPTQPRNSFLFRHSKNQYCLYDSLPLNSSPSQWTPVHTHTHTHTVTNKRRSKASTTLATHYNNPGSRSYTSNWLFGLRC